MRIANGVDIIEVARVQRGLDRFGRRFRDRFFTAAEQAQNEGRAASCAGRIAAKEAVAKALGTGIGDICWTDVEVLNDGRGRPELRLHGNAQRLAGELGWSDWSLSISHTSTQAIAFFVAVAGDGQ